MKRSIAISALAIIAAVNLYAGDAEDFFNKRGYEKGYEKGYKKGIEKGLEIAKKVLKNYKENIRAYEIGKYLIERRYLTYPQVWQVREGNSVRLVVTPARIEKELNIDELFDRFGSDIPEYPKKDEQLPQDKEKLNSVYIADRDVPQDLPDSASRDDRIVTMKVRKTYRNREILDRANLVYQDAGNYYKVMFFSSNEKRDFCRNFRKMCMGE